MLASPAVQPRPRIPAALRRCLPMLVLVRGMTDAQIAAEWGLGDWQVGGLRRALRIANRRGWPCGDAELRRLVLVEQLTDAEIGARFEVRPRTIEVQRLRLGLRRPNDPRPEARRVVVLADVVCQQEPTPIERAMKALGNRVRVTRRGEYVLDGRRVSVVSVLRAGGVA